MLNARVFGASAVLFSGMAIEGFLNCYSVIRLGRQAESRSFLVKATVEKAALLLRLVGAESPSRRSELFRRMKRLAKRRNDLVHPKTLEAVTGREHEKFEHVAAIAAESVSDMEYFFLDYERRDPASMAFTR